MMTEDGSGTAWDLLVQINLGVATALDLAAVLWRLTFAAVQPLEGERAGIIVLDDAGKPMDTIIVYGENLPDRATQRFWGRSRRGYWPCVSVSPAHERSAVLKVK